MKIKACNKRPNCVSSLSHGSHYVAPISLFHGAESARSRILEWAGKQGGKVEFDEDNYVHISLRSFLFGFVDDLELYFDVAENLIQVRSAARTGYWDLGVNRRRVEKIRRLVEQI